MPRIFFTEADRYRAAVYKDRARAALTDQGATREQLQTAYDELVAWHEAFHSPTAPPGYVVGAISGIYCTGCQVWPVIEELRTALHAEDRPE